MKKILALLTLTALVWAGSVSAETSALVPSAISAKKIVEQSNSESVDSGTFGENLEWDLRGTSYILYISGNGEMQTAEGTAPWLKYKDNITKIEIEEGVMDIGDFAFGDCSTLTSVSIPSSVTSIGNYAFRNCTMLQEIELPENVTSIGQNAFFACGLKDIIIPDKVESIGGFSFYQNDSLRSVTFGNSVTTIGGSAFKSCYELRSLRFPASLTDIASEAFSNCRMIEEITCLAVTPPSIITNYSFYGITRSIPVHVPAESVSDYNTSNWKEFTNIQAIEGDSVVDPQPSDTTSTRTIYLRIIDEWKTETTKYAVWYWMTGESGTWTDWMAQVDETIWSVQIPASTENVIFCRFNPEAEAPDWNYLWNQTVDLALTDSDLYTITGGAEAGQYGGRWSVYSKEEPQPSGVPTVEALTKYGNVSDSTVVLAMYFDETPCYDVVLTGSFCGWGTTDEDGIRHFQPMSGYEGWYWVEFPWALTEYDEAPGIKPVQLQYDGTFSWDYQAGDFDAWIHRGGEMADITAGYDDECNINLPVGGAYIYELAYWKKHKSACTISPEHTYIISLQAPNCADHPEYVPAIAGAFNGWVLQEMTHMATADVWEITIKGQEDTEFKFAELTQGWSNQFEYYNPANNEWSVFDNYTLPTTESETTNISFDYSDTTMYRYALCGLEEPTDTIQPQPETGTFTVTFTPEDFAGQGTSGSGGAVAASKDGVKFSCVKAYGAETHLRCYKIDTITITSESTITAIDFTFEEKYQGNLEMHYEVGDKEWMTEVTAQVRITGVNVTVTKSEVVAPDTIVEFPDNSLWPILMDEYTLNKYAGNIVASFIQNDADRFLYVWDNSYTGGDITGKNFYGNKNGYLALVVYGSWSGCGYTLTGDGDSWKNVEPLRQAIIANPEKYYLHLAIKSTDNYSHSFYLFGTETTPFTLGDTTQYGGYIYSNFDRDGEWHEFYIPMERFVDELKNVKVEAGHVIFSALTQGVQGAELNLDAVFFCDEQMKNTLMASDHEILSGTCGDSLTWGLTKDSVLTIEGSGVMYWQGESAPWSNYTDEITSVSLPEGLTNIYNKAFAGCNITSIQIPSSVTSIGSDAFNSTKLASIDIPSGVIEMDGAFSYCRLLSAINVAEDNSKYASINGVLFDKSKTTLLIYPTNKADTTYSVPEGVTAIADRAFQYCSAIESMIVANSVKSIGYQAFWSCTFMHSLVLGTSLDTIGNGAFSGCNSLTSVTVNSASIVGKDYNGQSGSASQSLMMQLGWQVQEIIFGEDITRIGNYALYYPSKSSCKLRTFTFPANIAEIGKGAFYNCKFDELSVPQQVTSIGENAFKNIKQIWYDGSATGSPWGAKCVNNNCATVTTEVDVTDGSIDEWNNLPVDYVFESICPINAKHQALKSLKVYAQDTYINLLVEPDMTLFTDLSWVPFHVYLDTDNSDATGGDDLGLFTDRNTDIYLETALFVENEPYDYNPAVFKWWGEPGGSGWYWQDPTVEHDGNDFWGAIVGEGMLPVGNSQYVDGKFEIQLNRELIPATWDENKFGIGIEIENSWVTNGALPAITPTDDNPVGSTRKLTIQIYHSDITPEDTTDISEPEPIVTVFGKDVVIIDPTDSTATMDEVDVFGDSTLVYNPQENTLTFSSLTLEVGDSVSTAISYTGTETLTIVLCDSSTIFADTVISSMGDVVVTGDGVLVAEAVVPIIGVPTASILFDSVTMHVRSLSSSAAVRRRIRGIKFTDEDGGPALSGFATVDYNKTAVTPPDAEYGEVEVSDSEVAGAPSRVINALYVVNPAGERVPLSEFDLTAIADDIPESIESTQTEQLFDPAQPMYNILGMPVGASYKGIVIQNGKTYLR